MFHRSRAWGWNSGTSGLKMEQDLEHAVIAAPPVSLRTLAHGVLERIRCAAESGTISGTQSEQSVPLVPTRRNAVGTPPSKKPRASDGEGVSESSLVTLEAEREHSADAAWERLRELYDRAGRPRDWLTPSVRSAVEDVEALWLAARLERARNAPFLRALDLWESVASVAITIAGEEGRRKHGRPRL